MFNVGRDLGVQSYCFRGFKALEALLEQVKALGVTRMELCVVHVDFDNEASFEGVIGQCAAAGIRIGSIGVQRFRGEATEEKWFRFCKLAGARMISSTFDVAAVRQAFPIVQNLAEKYDVVLGIHNHGGYDWLGNSMMIKHTLDNVGPRIGLCLDTAWCMQAGEDPLQWVERFGERMYGVHVKDFVFDRAGKWSDVVVGTGNLKLRELLKAVHACPRLEALTLEYEGDVENPGPRLRECVEAIRAANAS